MEPAILALHIFAGSVAILAGYVAIAAAKGADTHRRSGMWFVAAMVVMGMSGFVVAIVRDIPGSLTGGPVAAYFVITALTTVRPMGRRLELAMLAVILTMFALSTNAFVQTVSAGKFALNGVPVPMIAMFSIVELSGAVGDVRLMRGRVLSGSQRIVRHLWRMCFAFWLATGSFFIGQMDELPSWLQHFGIVALPAFFPLLAMFYWLWRIRGRKLMTGLTVARSAP
jgi:uncharacterized membrane protein